jgi:hypothetical protein
MEELKNMKFPSMAGLSAEIWTWDLPYTKQELYLFYRDFRWSALIEVQNIACNKFAVIFLTILQLRNLPLAFECEVLGTLCVALVTLQPEMNV